MFPRNEEEGKKAMVGVMKMLYSNEVRDSILKNFETATDIPEAIGTVLASLMLKLMESVGTTDFNKEYAIKLGMILVKEILTMGEAAGLWKIKDIPAKARQGMVQMGMAKLDQMISQKGQQGQGMQQEQQAPQQVPQGQPGAMQGMMQQGGM